MCRFRPVCFPTLLACALLFFLGTVVGDRCHEPQLDIGDEAGLAADICSINRALGRSPPDYVTAEAFYRLGYKSRDTTLMNITTGEVLRGGFVGDSFRLFKEEGWMHDIMLSALGGNGSFTDDTKRVQVIKKLLQGSALGHLLFSNLHRSFRQVENAHRRKAEEYVERAMANFYGLDSDCSIFGNGQARGVEFGTMEEGVSTANVNLVESFTDAILAIRDFPIEEEEVMIAFETIEKSFITIYLQAVVKYATRIIDDNNAEKAQAEGFGYYHAIAGQVHAVDKEEHELIYAAFDIASDPDPEKAEEALEAVRRLLKDFGIDNSLFGEYDEDREEYVPPNKIGCEGLNPFVVTNVDFIDSDR